tara:strand:+ start:9317 stop:10213 length:897 start_codon:yes stop_codon:yes gene_type:complete
VSKKLKVQDLSEIKKIYQAIRYGILQRHVYYMTSPLRILPEVIIIGVGRGGTTSLFHYLSQHPCIRGSAYDELGFFDENYHLGINWYRSLFPTKSSGNEIMKKFGRFLTYEVTPQYLRKPWVAKRILETYPNMKLIVMLRNPIDKSLSHYHLAKRNNHKLLKKDGKIMSFDEVVDKDIKFLSNLDMNNLDENYFRNVITKTFLGRGFYAQFFNEWFKVFSRKQFLILSTEELADQTQNVLKQIFRFLNIPEMDIPDIQKHNTGKYDSMNENTRHKLAEFFHEHNQNLYKLLDRDFGWK